MNYEQVAEECLRKDDPLSFIENVMFEMSSKLPDTVCEKTWDEIADVFIRRAKTAK